MKKRFSYLAILIYLSLIVIILYNVFGPQELLPSNSPYTTGLPNASSTYPEQLPTIVVKMNFHFIQTEEGENFKHGKEQEEDWQNGTYAAKMLVKEANNLFANLEVASPTSTHPFLGDTKIRFELYPSPEKAVHFWETLEEAKEKAPSKDEIINVFLINEPDTVDIPGGRAFIQKRHFHIYQWYKKVKKNPKYFKSWFTKFRKIFLHEMGHLTGLCHTFDQGTNCTGIDIDPILECNDNGNPPIQFCKGEKIKSNCDSENSTSTNIMAYSREGLSLTQCQWEIYYNFVKDEVGKTTFADLCSLPAGGDITINSLEETWDQFRHIEGNITVKSGNTLIISSLIGMGENSAIIVERGASLKVLGGMIVNACNGKKWDGIYLEGNTGFASDTAPNSSQNLQPASFYSEKGLIKGAKKGISTSKYQEPWNRKFWGGIITAISTEFLDNTLSIELKNHEFSPGNLISDQAIFAYCDFLQKKEQINPNNGVKIIGCKNIEFKNCSFEGHGGTAIQSIDAGVNIDSENHFKNNNVAVNIMTTLPFNDKRVVIGKEDNIYRNEMNKFLDNNIGILVNSADQLNGISILNNYFESSTSEDNNFGGIYYLGNAAANICGNRVFGMKNGLVLMETADTPIAINCNTFNLNQQYNIGVFGENSGSTFQGNMFYSSTTASDICIQAIGESKGQIAYNQGDQVNGSANNCFSKPNGIIAPPKKTESFLYFGNSVVTLPCYFTDDSYENFTYQRVSNVNPDMCQDAHDPLLKSRVKRSALKKQKQLTVTAYSEYTQDFSSNLKRSVYEYEKSKEAYLRRSLFAKMVIQQKWEEAESMLATESIDEAPEWILALQFLKKDYKRAEQLIRSWPIDTEENQFFKQIMQINLDMATMSNFELSNDQKAFLNEVIQSEQIALKGYAKGILALWE